MKKSFLKELFWIAGCSFGLLILLFSFKTDTPASCSQPSCCKASASTEETIPAWESISRQFVSAISIY